MLDASSVQRVKTGYAQVEGLSEGVKPVVKVPLVIANTEGVVVISELVDEDGEDSEDVERPNTRRRVALDSTEELVSQVRYRMLLFLLLS